MPEFTVKNCFGQDMVYDTETGIENYGVFIPMILQYLECESITELELLDNSTENDEEGWLEPEDFVMLGKAENCSVPGFSIGELRFGTWRGRKVVLECNASPVAVLAKKCA